MARGRMPMGMGMGNMNNMIKQAQKVQTPIGNAAER